MKKIVALVLALVMVMGLATVASAASTSSETKMGTETTITAAEKYALYQAESTDVVAGWDVVAYTGLSTKVDTVDGVATTGYIPAYYTITNGTSTCYVYEVADAACADFRIFKGDAFVAYVSGTQNAKETSFVSDTVVFVAEGKGCGTYKADVYMNTVTYAAAKAVFAGDVPSAGKKAIMDGKYVFLNNAAERPVDHTFAAVETFDAKEDLIYKSTTDNTVVGVVCTKCDKTFTVVKSGKIPASYKGLTTPLPTFDNIYTVLLQDVVDAPAAGTTAGDKVQSAETFDAGIAMYVGMSVMAAAGSAVVLKKKD